MGQNKNERIKKTTHPKTAAKLGAQKGTQDAFCTECKNWYDSTNKAQVDQHAH